MPGMYNLIFVFFGSLISGGRVFLLALSAAGQASLPWYTMTHVWISAELRGGARRIERRTARPIWQGKAFRLPEASRSFGIPQNCFSKFDNLINIVVMFFFHRCYVRKKMACYSHNLSSITAAVAAATTRTKLTSAAAQPQQ